MKYRISKIFVVICIFSIILSTNVFGVANLSVSSPTTKAGQEVTVDISINDNTGFVGYQMELYYDSNKLEYISGSNGEVVSSKLAIISNNEEKGSVKQACVSADVVNSNGKLMSVIFKVKENITDGKIPLELKMSEFINDIGEEQVVDVEYNISNGAIVLQIEEGGLTSSTTNDKIEIVKNEDGSFKVNVKDNSLNNKKITYRSLNETKAIVDENGNITILGNGDVEIEALIDDEVIDKATLSIPTDEEINELNILNQEENVDSSLSLFTRKNIYIIIAIVVIIVFVIIGIILLKRKKESKMKNEKK